MPDPNRPAKPDDEFFVGYLPMPKRTSRFTWIVLVVLLGSSAAVAGAAAWFQKEPGQARGRSGEATGLMIADPYGMVRTFDDEGAIQHVLLVRGGKFGAPRSAREEFDGQAVSVQGLSLNRQGGELIELHASVSAAEMADEDLERLRNVPTEDLGDVSIVGEIVDAKCYFGRMRPGDGRTHRACAQLCIAGNIPPILVARDPSGNARHYVLATEDNHSISRAILPWVAEPVRVRGRLYRTADLRVLRIRLEDIDRL